jgi:hypothetical protein
VDGPRYFPLLHSLSKLGRGFRSARSEEHGNLIIDFEILFPLALSLEDRELVATGPLSRCQYPTGMDVENGQEQ